ncbi:hypothetical protein K1W69_24285 [Hoeflea sp. WL0058]|uniref:Uncharacterized protein n=1 Tax=Flavimaribacter sediminis TaxID=2865987 RepID=A0AAE2ZSS8_9HYPH|nr:hypothetical protein [Flavimaribacter sediminis]MBW8640332.1 hypothetical protein [Flavimaribacter sediminis]
MPTTSLPSDLKSGARAALLSLFLASGPATIAIAQENAREAADALSPKVVAVVSGGRWESSADGDAGSGYYRAVAVRSQDNTSRLYLQKLGLSDGSPTVLDTREIQELTDMSAYITDMRPENSTGVSENAGFVTYVYLKEDPSITEPDTWELFVDEFGDHEFLPASN